MQRGQDGAQDSMKQVAEDANSSIVLDDPESGPLRCNNIAASLYCQFARRHIFDGNNEDADAEL